MRSTAALSALAIAGTLAVAGPASASTLAVGPDGTLHFSAGPGETNHVDLSDLVSSAQTVVTDTGSIITVGAGCVQVTAHQATCPLPGFSQDVAIDLGDRDDFAHAFKLGFGHVAIDGGPGADTIEDLPQSGADVTGGPGDDTITVHPNGGGSVDVHGDAGSDTISAIAGAGVVRGDAGADRISLTSFVEPFPGAGSAAYGGAGADTITADGGTGMSLIDGGLGDDTISTGALAQVARFVGGPGADSITSLNGTSQIAGGLGADVIDGGGDGDTIDCGLGLDRFVSYPGDTVAGCEIALP